MRSVGEDCSEALGGLQGSQDGGSGRVRIEANSITIGDSFPPASNSIPGDPPLYDIWPPEDAPALKVTQIDYIDAQTGKSESVLVPDDPEASLDFPSQDVAIDTEQDITLHIEASNVPIDWVVAVRVVPKSGDSIVIDPDVNGDPPPTGDDTFWTRTVTFLLPSGIMGVQLRAAQP